MKSVSFLGLLGAGLFTFQLCLPLNLKRAPETANCCCSQTVTCGGADCCSQTGPPREISTFNIKLDAKCVVELFLKAEAVQRFKNMCTFFSSRHFALYNHRNQAMWGEQKLKGRLSSWAQMCCCRCVQSHCSRSSAAARRLLLFSFQQRRQRPSCVTFCAFCRQWFTCFFSLAWWGITSTQKEKHTNVCVYVGVAGYGAWQARFSLSGYSVGGGADFREL